MQSLLLKSFITLFLTFKIFIVYLTNVLILKKKNSQRYFVFLHKILSQRTLVKKARTLYIKLKYSARERSWLIHCRKGKSLSIRNCMETIFQCVLRF